MNSQSLSRTNSAGRPRTPARPLYAARLPPIQHPLGAPESSPRPNSLPTATTTINDDDEPEIQIHTEPVTPVSVPKIRPTTARPLGTLLSAKSNLNGSVRGLKPLPAIGEPMRRVPSRSNIKRVSAFRSILKCLIICAFLCIPVVIFVIMMVLSGGFAPLIEGDEFGNDNSTTVAPITKLAPKIAATMGTPAPKVVFTTLAAVITNPPSYQTVNPPAPMGNFTNG